MPRGNITYTEPRHSATDGARDHRTSKWRLILSDLGSSDLLYSLINTEVETSANGVPDHMQVKASVKAAYTMTVDNLPDRLKCSHTWLASQSGVLCSIRSRLATVGHQHRGLNDILGKLKGT